MKKFLLIILTLALTLSLVFAAVACDNVEEPKNTTPDHDHVWSDWQAIGATSPEAAKIATHHIRTCSSCTEYQLEEHTYGGWTETKAPTTTETGSKERTCSVCGYRDVVTLPILHFHTYSDAYTFDATGHWHAATCEHTTEISGFEAHTFGDWNETKAPTADETGIKEHVCSVCGYKETQTVPKLIVTLTAVGSTSYAVTGVSDPAATTLEIPSTYNGQPVTAVNALSSTALTTLIVPSSVTKLSNLECANLEKLVLPNKIANYSSINCPKVTAIYFGGTLADYLKTSIQTSDVTKMNYALYLKDAEGSVTENGETYSLVKDVVIPSGFTTVRATAFWGCTSIESVTLHANVGAILNHAFSECPNLQTVVNNSTKSKIMDETAFYGSPIKNLTATYQSLLIQGSGTNNYRAIEIAKDTLVTLTINGTRGTSTVNATDWYKGAEHLTTVTFAADFGVVPSYIFRDCDALVNLTLPTNSIRIEQYAFEGCDNLAEVTLPATLVSVNAYAFANTKIAEPNFPASLRIIGEHAYENTPITALTLPASVTDIGNYAFNNCAVATFTAELTSDEGDISCGTLGIAPRVASIHAALFNKISKTNLEELYITGGTAISNSGDTSKLRKAVLTSVETIDNCFSKAYLLDEIDMPVVRSITGSFSDLPKYTIRFPATLTVLDGDSFLRCYHLAEVYNPSGVTIPATYEFDYLSDRMASYVKLVHTDASEPSLISKQGDLVFVLAHSSALGRDGVLTLVDYLGDDDVFVSPATATNPVSGTQVTYAIGGYAFANKPIVYFDLREGVVALESNAFSYCTTMIGGAVSATLEAKEMPTSIRGYEWVNGSALSFGEAGYVISDTATRLLYHDEDADVWFQHYNTANRIVRMNVSDYTTVVLPTTFSVGNDVMTVNSLEKDAFLSAGANYQWIGIVASTDLSIISARVSRVYYLGTQEQYNSLVSTKPNGATVFYYSESAPETSGNYWKYDDNDNVCVWINGELWRYNASGDRYWRVVNGQNVYY